MVLAEAALGQMAMLLLLVAAGFVLAKTGAVASSAVKSLAKLENTLFIPALAMGTFMTQCTPARLAEGAWTLLAGTVLWCAVLPLALALPRLLTREEQTRRIYTYGLAFSNFGFMGNAVVVALFPELFLDYMLFTLPPLATTYLWGAPILLTPPAHRTGTKWWGVLLNPMLIGMALGILVGVTELSLPGWFCRGVEGLGACMSPVAMLLTGLTVAALPLPSLFRDWRVYLLSAVRLLGLPLLFLGLAAVTPMPADWLVLGTAVLAMPLGLNTVVVPSAYGCDPTAATGMVLVSHLLAGGTIPAVFWLMSQLL